MDSPVIVVENLSKRYVLGQQRSKDDGLRHVLDDAVRAPGKWLRRLGGAAAEKPNEFLALQDVSFAVQQGEILGVIGRNGAGKSTLLKILSCITEPTRGRITIRGRVASLLEVGTGFHPELTGRENIFLNGAILGMSRAEIKRKFDEIVEFSEVEKFLDTPVKRYSSGMYVRLAFAVAAHLEPEILIIDEVLAVGDVQFQAKCLGKMQSVAAAGRTVLFVSHNLGAVRRLCTHGLLMQSGKIVSRGSIEKVLLDYGETFSAGGDGDWADQHGRTKVTITAVDLLVNGIKSESVAAGERLQLRIGLRLDGSIHRRLRVGFALENMAGVYTMINYSHYQGVTFEPRDGMVTAEVGDLPLGEGLYRLHLRITESDTEIYWNTNLRTIRIESGDFYGTGVRGEENLCPWLQKVQWRQVAN